MPDFPRCPNCGRKDPPTPTPEGLPVFKCAKCGLFFCPGCGDGPGGVICPHCGDRTYRVAGRVVAPAGGAARDHAKRR